MQERMDAAVTRAVIRVVAVGISGTLGFAVMWKYDMATNPYGLTVILCAWAALLGERLLQLPAGGPQLPMTCLGPHAAAVSTCAAGAWGAPALPAAVSCSPQQHR